MNARGDRRRILMASGIDLVRGSMSKLTALAKLDPWIKPARGDLRTFQAAPVMIDLPIRCVGPKLRERVRMRGLSATAKTGRNEE